MKEIFLQVPITIHETAFVTARFRATDAALSGDRYAHLWQHPQTDQWIASYLQQVSPEEPYTHCLRNRFFLETLNRLVADEGIQVVLNFGCGFSMYPFLAKASLRFIEIDKPEIVDFKKQVVDKWQQEKILPHRQVDYIGVDFTTAYEAGLHKSILPLVDGKKTLIILEGVLFFLSMTQAVQLFDFFNSIQQPGDYICSGSFEPSIENTPVFQRLLTFFNQTISEQGTGFLTLPLEFYTVLNNYKLIDHQEYESLAAAYHYPTTLATGEVLNEHGYLLQKTVDV